MNQHDPVASIVRRRWMEVLGTSTADDGDDFFLSGGHSLLAVQLTNALRCDLGVRVLVSAVFEASDLAGYVERIRHQVEQEGATAVDS